MRNLGFLDEPLPVSNEPGLAGSDERYIEVSELAGDQKFSEAADRVEKLVADQVYDVRMMGYLFMAVFHEDGIPGLAAVFNAATAMVSKNYDAVGPEKKRSVHFDKTLGWLVGTIADACEYHVKTGTPEWATWSEELGPDDYSEMADAVGRLQDALQALDLSASMQRAGRLRDWFTGRRELLLAAEAAAAAAAAAEEEEPEAKRLSTRPPARRDSSVPTKVGSTHLRELVAKLDAFEELVAKEEYTKAALVSHDVLELLEAFDPRKYFPDLFASFFAALTNNVGAIAPHWENRESVEWKTLEQFYQVDLEGFVGRK